MKQSRNNRQYRGNRQPNQQFRAQQTIAQTPVNSFKYEKHGLTGVVLVQMKNGNTVEVQISDPNIGIKTFQKELKFYTAYTTEQLGAVNQVIRDHAQELKLTEMIWFAIQNSGGQLQLGGQSFLVVEATMENNAVLGKILAKAASAQQQAQTPGKNGSGTKTSPTDQQRQNA